MVQLAVSKEERGVTGLLIRFLSLEGGHGALRLGADARNGVGELSLHARECGEGVLAEGVVGGPAVGVEGDERVRQLCARVGPSWASGGESTRWARNAHLMVGTSVLYVSSADASVSFSSIASSMAS